ncbi:hypothetical protein EDF54_2750 [Rathayibacter sp. PhB93]|uniref:hypothetical protein n=1 Tax=unclassified Rathayibacter TaxID=2609250 RepID=UPI000FAE5E60|nr:MULTISPECIES: hypothetical protein [unclassified Rathayibacter]ROQ04541.1 hypothetical protein EDF54_2750 [Rathayibacter sp. PhB93]TDQ13379.1 hypothetical protein EDF17_1985 [Rathayibacter sp. PhB1]
MKLWKTMAIGSTAAVLVGLSAVSPAMAAPDANTTATAVAPAASPAQELTTPGPRAARPLSVPGYDLVQVEDRTVSYRIVDESEVSRPRHILKFSNGGAPQAVSLTVSYLQSNGTHFTEVSPLLDPSGPGWSASIMGDVQDVDVQVHDASGAIIAERSYPGEPPAGDPVVFWERSSTFDLPGYTFQW